MSGRFSDHL